MFRYSGHFHSKLWCGAFFLIAPLSAVADPAAIEGVKAIQDANGHWTISVTIRHADTGWDDYADGWRVELPDGTILGTRVLYHPHVNEQPFTRSLSNIPIPEGTITVEVRARTLLTDWDSQTVSIELEQ